MHKIQRSLWKGHKVMGGNLEVRKAKFSDIFREFIRPMGVHVNLERKGSIGIMRLNSPGKVNVLTVDVMREMEEAIAKVTEDKNILASVIIGKQDCFIAGVDIKTLKLLTSFDEITLMGNEVQNMLFSIEESKKPFVSAIMGSCLGGGLEVALACHYRIGVRSGSTVLGLPEVLLGAMPGAGGTQRLPKLIGLQNAMDMALTGRHVKAEKAFKIGLIDRLVDEIEHGVNSTDTATFHYLENIAIDSANKLANKTLKPNRKYRNTTDKIIHFAMQVKPIKNIFFNQAKTRVLKQTKNNYPAPIKILETFQKGIDEGPKAGYKAETNNFAHLLTSHQSKGLISLYQATTECRKNIFGTPSIALKNLGIIGHNSTFVEEVTKAAVKNGFHVVLKGTDQNKLAEIIENVKNKLKNSEKRNKIYNITAPINASNIITTLKNDHFHNIEFIIECMADKFEAKQLLIQDIAKYTPASSILATTTALCSISEIAAKSTKPKDVIGMHYPSLLKQNQVVEIVIGKQTSLEAKQAAVEVGLRQGKKVIVIKDSPGFYINRVIHSGLDEVLTIILDGMNLLELNKVTENIGFSTGLINMIDNIGFEYFLQIQAHLNKVLEDIIRKEDKKSLLETLMAAGSKGFFIFNKKHKTVNTEAVKIVNRFISAKNVSPETEAIESRIVLRIVNEAMRCLQEGIIESPAEGDVGAVLGGGFPPFTGGPFKYVDVQGAKTVKEKLQKLENKLGARFTPCQMIVDRAYDSHTFFYH